MPIITLLTAAENSKEKAKYTLRNCSWRGIVNTQCVFHLDYMKEELNGFQG